MTLTREQILSRKPKRLTVAVPEWEDHVLIQALTVGAAQSISTEDGILDLVIASVISDDGTPLFSPEDKEGLRRLEFSGLRRIAEAAAVFNAIAPAALEDLAKNSAPGLNGSSSSS